MNAPSKTEVEAPYVLREDKDGVATLTLNRGDRMNPLSTAMLSALQAELGRLAKDTAARVVVLAGAGKHFCAGHDLREMRSHPDKAWQKALFEQCSEMMLCTSAPVTTCAKCARTPTRPGRRLFSSSAAR